MELQTLQEAFSNFSSNTLTEIQALDSHGELLGGQRESSLGSNRGVCRGCGDADRGR